MAIVTEDFAGEFMTASDQNYRLYSCSCKLCAKTKSLSSGETVSSARAFETQMFLLLVLT